MTGVYQGVTVITERKEYVLKLYSARKNTLNSRNAEVNVPRPIPR